MNTQEKIKLMIYKMSDHFAGIMSAGVDALFDSVEVRNELKQNITGDWICTEKGPDVTIFNDGEHYKITLTSITSVLKIERKKTYILNFYLDDLCYINVPTGQVDLVYDKTKDTLFLSPGGEYIRKYEPIKADNIEFEFNPSVKL